MTALAMGATGRIGRQVIDHLLRRGERVRAPSRRPAAARLPEGAEVVGGGGPFASGRRRYPAQVFGDHSGTAVRHGRRHGQILSGCVCLATRCGRGQPHKIGSMKILWVFAHPEQRSLNGSLMDEGLRTLKALGHEYRVSDLYAMGWKAVVDADDFGHESRDRLFVGQEQERAYGEGQLSEDILNEQEKIAWAEVLVFQFPLWWFGPPAILKGWFDRVLVQGFGFGIKDTDGRTLRYGDGGLAGKRAMVITSVGARESGFGPRGIHGHLDEVLFPLLHGTFWYTGMAALPPLVVYGADRFTDTSYAQSTAALRERLRTLRTAKPLPFRHENGGGYDESLVLRPALAPGLSGVGVHRVKDVEEGGEAPTRTASRNTEQG